MKTAFVLIIQGNTGDSRNINNNYRLISLITSDSKIFKYVL